MPWGWSLHKSSGTGGLPTSLKWLSYMDVWPFYGKVKFASLSIGMGTIHLYGKNIENFKRPLLKPLSQCCSNFMWSLVRLGEGKIAKMVVVHWLRWLQCPYMVKTFKNLLLQNQISPGVLSLHKPSGTGDLPKLLQWWSYVDIWPFYGKVKFACHAFVWALYLYMGKMLRIHILDISSIIQLNLNLMMSIRALMRHKMAKWANRKSKMATTTAIVKISFRYLFSNLRSLWAETCCLATRWLLGRNKLKLCRSKIQDGRNGSASLNKNTKSSNDISSLAKGLISKYLHRSIPPMALNQNY